ncbi:hypothetical protein ACGFIP_29540 [Micromonospora zamorensis]|uniref:hypothetical protein n=1 Tax=Micromonospora zamorensis TaxID=709883 RepID=UPI00371C2C8C
MAIRAQVGIAASASQPGAAVEALRVIEAVVVITPGKPRFDYYRLLALHAAAGDSSRRMSRAEIGCTRRPRETSNRAVRRLLFRQVEQVPMSAIALSAFS